MSEETALASVIEPLEELFDRDPLSLNTDDIARIVKYYRGLREKFIQAELAGKPAPRVAKAKPGVLPGQLSLASLGLVEKPKPDPKLLSLDSLGLTLPAPGA